MDRRTVDRIASVIGSRPLATDIARSVTAALRSPLVHLPGGKTVWEVFAASLHVARLDFTGHPRADLFRRLLRYGVPDPDAPEDRRPKGETVLTDVEAAACVEFMYSYMVNRFKGELAELLALEPCLALVQEAVASGRLPQAVQLYWGDAVRERRQGGDGQGAWSSFAKGADGLLAEELPAPTPRGRPTLRVRGVVEIKSMARSRRKLLAQIHRHLSRLSGGVALCGTQWSPDEIVVPPRTPANAADAALRIMVTPSAWRVSRDWHMEEQEGVRRMVFPVPSEPPAATRTIEVEPDVWHLSLSWSEDALNQAAYEMTYLFMGELGTEAFADGFRPGGWESLTAEEAGYNAVKMALYYLPLRSLSRRHDRLTARLYNVYAFGYPLGADSREMLWPEDLEQARAPGEDD